MTNVFKRRSELPPVPSLPTPGQISEDLEAAGLEDPAFFVTSMSVENNKTDDTFLTAQEFMNTTTKLKELEKVLTAKKMLLEESFQELHMMSENIRQQATEALSNIY